MTFAHTTVEDPKYGASRRVAQISVASDDAPAVKTTAGSRRGGTPRS
jgi:hypothetical protein